jgi:hypothetical protein
VVDIRYAQLGVLAGRQRHVDPVHSKSRKEQREAGKRRVALPAVWRRDSIFEGRCRGWDVL